MLGAPAESFHKFLDRGFLIDAIRGKATLSEISAPTQRRNFGPPSATLFKRYSQARAEITFLVVGTTSPGPSEEGAVAK